MSWRRFFDRGIPQEQRLDAELQFHIEQLIRDNMKSGMTEEEARRKARGAFGTLDPIKDDCRNLRRFSIIESTLQDFRYALRTMRKNWGFSTVVVLSLALGIGANTAIFTLIDAVMWRMLPVKDPETLMLLARAAPAGPESGFTYQQYRAMRENNEAAEVTGYSPVQLNVSVDGGLEPAVPGQLVGGNYFSMLGVSPVWGRAFTLDDDRLPNGHPVAVISYGYWSRRFGRDPGVIGTSILISGTRFTILGVTPSEFFGLEVGSAPDIFVPMTMQPAVMPAYENLLENPIITKTWVQTLARLKPGVSAEQAAAVLQPIARAQLPAATVGIKNFPLRDLPLALIPAANGLSGLRRQFSQPLFILMAMVGIVLLVACANTANLLLARSAARGKEFAMRFALGASRSRVMRQILAESVLLAGLGGLCGIGLARLATHFLVIYMSSGRNPIALDLNPDLGVLAFTAAVSLFTGMAFGLVPALRSTKIALTPALKTLGGLRQDFSRLNPGKVFAVAQVALSLLLLIAAGLFVRSLQNLDGQDSGFSRESVLTVRLEPKGSDQRGIAGTAERLDRIYTELLQRTRAIPGVRSATLANVSPTRPDSGAGMRLPGPAGEIMVSNQVIYPDYFQTLGIPMAAGRDFNGGDVAANSPAVCIVNETYARQVFLNENPIGRPCGAVLRSPLTRRPAPNPVIVGVAKDSRYTNLRAATRPVLYAPFLFANTGRGQMILYVRAFADPGLILPRIREEVWKADKDVPQFEILTLADEVDAALIQDRLIATLSSWFSIAAMLLASIGLYGLFAFTVVQRTREMGIRAALGAARGNVVWMILKEALSLVVVGIAIGLPLALATARVASSWISGLLFGLEATDPAAISFAIALLLVVATIAVYLPARKASRVDPTVALRNE